MDFATSWRHLGTLGKIDAIRAVWVEGCSASQIAANFREVSRNAVIGVYNRYGKTHLTDKPLRDAAKNRPASRKREVRKQMVMRPPVIAPKPRPEHIFEPNESHLCGKPMMMLQAKECRFAVNDAEGDELHLFCGRPAERSYCEHHHGRAMQPESRR